MNTAAEIYPWQIRHGYSSWRIPLTHQAWMQQLKNNPGKLGMDTAAKAIPLKGQARIHQLKYTPWQIRHGYSSWSIPLTNQSWIQQLMYISDTSNMDTAAVVCPTHQSWIQQLKYMLTGGNLLGLQNYI